jgi:hypothetical protein
MVTGVTIACFRKQTGHALLMTTPETNRAEAVAWLVGRLRFEQLLTDLQARATANGAQAHLATAETEPERKAA